MAPKPKRSEPKAKGTSRASKPRKSTTKSTPKADAKAKPGAEARQAASRLVDERIRSLGGWRAETLAEVRRLIHQANPDIIEECKWIKAQQPIGRARVVSR